MTCPFALDREWTDWTHCTRVDKDGRPAFPARHDPVALVVLVLKASAPISAASSEEQAQKIRTSWPAKSSVKTASTASSVASEVKMMSALSDISFQPHPVAEALGDY